MQYKRAIVHDEVENRNKFIKGLERTSLIVAKAAYPPCLDWLCPSLPHQHQNHRCRSPPFRSSIPHCLTATRHQSAPLCPQGESCSWACCCCCSCRSTAAADCLPHFPFPVCHVATAAADSRRPAGSTAVCYPPSCRGGWRPGRGVRCRGGHSPGWRGPCRSWGGSAVPRPPGQ